MPPSALQMVLAQFPGDRRRHANSVWRFGQALQRRQPAGIARGRRRAGRRRQPAGQPISLPLPPAPRPARTPRAAAAGHRCCAHRVRFRARFWMIKVLLVLHVFVTIALIGVVLIQRSEGGGLGLGGGQGMGNFMSGRGTANLLTRTTAILGTAFFVLSLSLAILYKGGSSDNAAAILNAPPQNSPVSIPGHPIPGQSSTGLGASLPQTPADARPAPPPGPTQPNLPAPGVPAPSVPLPGQTTKTN